MTSHKHFKQLVRARMGKTGESYSSARRQVLRQAETPTPGKPGSFHFPGSVPAAAALRALLAQAGVRAPHTRAPFSEAMVFGIAGGIGAGMFTFHYAQEDFSSFYVAGRHLWQDHLAWTLAATRRFKVPATVREASGNKPAEKQLRELLAGGRPVMLWLTFRGMMYHLATVHTIDDAAGVALVGDLADALIPVPLPALAAARARVKKDKNRALALEPAVAKLPDLAELVREGIGACAAALAKGRTKNFTLDAFATWAERLDGSKAPDAWEKIFPPGPLLYQGLKAIAEYIEYYGTGGGLCRPLFAEFLEEASSALGDKSLAALADRYAELGRNWSALATAALPEQVPLFRETRELLGQRHEAVTALGEEEASGGAECWQRIQQMNAKVKDGFPLDAVESAALRRELKRRVLELVAGERDALAAMTRWLER